MSNRALGEFRDGRFDVLVATDVAGRGLDVKGITHVINYDMPSTIEGTYYALIYVYIYR
jgi:superfamily II DNA/RNA helicase